MTEASSLSNVSIEKDEEDSFVDPGPPWERFTMEAYKAAMEERQKAQDEE